MTGVLLRGETHRKKMPYDERKGDDSDASTSQKMPKITGRYQKIEKAMKDPLLWASEGTWPGDTSILYF